jgi:RNA polymerase sigma factor (sigma-70 family)
VAAESLGEVLRRIGRTAGLQAVLALTDAQLLDRFAAARDEPAFAALVVRHGPMVLGVCRRLLPDAGQAEDAFQAAFLVLARKAGAIRRRPLLSAWLYGVTYKVAARLRGRLWRRRAREKPVDLDALPAADAQESFDLAPAVHEEVQRLPDKYRDPVVFCYLEGRTHEEAARLLDCPLGTVKGRLARARDLLRSRLARRGLAPCEAAVALAVRPAAPRPAVVDATVRAAPLVAAGDPTGGGLASARAVMLSQGVVRTMMLTNWKIMAAVVLAALLLAGTGGYVYQSARGEPGGTQPGARAADKPGGADNAKDDKGAIQGTWQVTAVEMGGKDVSGTDEFKDLATAKWTFAADKITFKSGKPDMSVNYKIDPSKKPKELDVTPTDGPENERNKQMPAVYSLEGDVLKICVGSPDAPARPKEVASKEGEKNLLITFKRVEGGKDKPEAKPGDDKEAIQGAWQVTDFEVKGKGPDEATLKQIKAARWIFTADMINVQTPGEKEAPASYTLDASKSPKQIDFGPLGSPPQEAIYSLEGDVLKICVAGPEGGPRPKDFAANEGGKTVVLTLKRVKDGKDKSADKPKDDKEAIQGVWKVESVATGGKEGMNDNDEDLNKLKSSKFIFTAEKLTIQPDRAGPQVASYKLDPTKKPKELDLTPEDDGRSDKVPAIPAIYSLEADVLKLCLPPPADRTRPTELATREGDKTVLFTLKRVKEGKDKPTDKPHDDKEVLQGTWNIIRVEAGGKAAPDDGKTRELKSAAWTFAGDKITISGLAQGKDATATFALDPSKTPREIDFTPLDGPAGKPAKAMPGIYSLEGGVLKICIPMPAPPEAANSVRPRELATKADGATMVLTLKRDQVEEGVKEINGQSILLADGERFLLDEGTDYSAETGFDATPAKRTDVTVGKRVVVAWKVNAGKPTATAVFILKDIK